MQDYILALSNSPSPRVRGRTTENPGSTTDFSRILDESKRTWSLGGCVDPPMSFTEISAQKHLTDSMGISELSPMEYYL